MQSTGKIIDGLVADLRGTALTRINERIQNKDAQCFDDITYTVMRVERALKKVRQAVILLESTVDTL
jgi:hypothetical protein